MVNTILESKLTTDFPYRYVRFRYTGSQVAIMSVYYDKDPTFPSYV